MRLQSLMVAMNGEEVGTLYRDGDGAMSFQYATSWLQDVDARPISLSLPLRAERHRGAAVFNFFQNLLPDSDAILTRMQTRFQVATTHPFDLLAAIGRDCVGAIQLYPANSKLPPVTSMTATPLTESQIAALLAGYQTAPLGMTEHNDFRISLAGAQEKTALLWFQGRWQQPLGSSATSHIFKLPIGRLEHHNIDLSDSCENEWLCLQIAKAFGFEAANAELAALWPLKRFPVLLDDGRCILESSTIVAHLQAHHPGSISLIPPGDAGLEVHMLDRIFDNYVMTPMQKVVLDALRPQTERAELKSAVAGHLAQVLVELQHFRQAAVAELDGQQGAAVERHLFQAGIDLVQALADRLARLGAVPLQGQQVVLALVLQQVEEALFVLRQAIALQSFEACEEVLGRGHRHGEVARFFRPLLDEATEAAQQQVLDTVDLLLR